MSTLHYIRRSVYGATFSPATRAIASTLYLATLMTPDAALAQSLYELREAGEPIFEEDLISCAVGSIFRLIEGSFGALVMVVAGLGAIVAAAMGAYRATLGMLVVAVGSFILRALVSLFFYSDVFTTCG